MPIHFRRINVSKKLGMGLLAVTMRNRPWFPHRLILISLRGKSWSKAGCRSQQKRVRHKGLDSPVCGWKCQWCFCDLVFRLLILLRVFFFLCWLICFVGLVFFSLFASFSLSLLSFLLLICFSLFLSNFLPSLLLSFFTSYLPSFLSSFCSSFLSFSLSFFFLVSGFFSIQLLICNDVLLHRFCFGNIGFLNLIFLFVRLFLFFFLFML